MIILIGESASGKSTIERDLVKEGYSKIVSYTTRPMRMGESDGVDYHYISEEKFNEKLSEGFFVEFTRYNDWLYGVAKEDCADDKVVVVEPSGFLQLLKNKDLNIKSFYIKVDERERLVRMSKRGDNILEIFRRIVSDQGVFQWVSEEVDYIIDNNSYNGLYEILSILKSDT